MPCIASVPWVCYICSFLFLFPVSFTVEESSGVSICVLRYI